MTMAPEGLSVRSGKRFGRDLAATGKRAPIGVGFFRVSRFIPIVGKLKGEHAKMTRPQSGHRSVLALMNSFKSMAWMIFRRLNGLPEGPVFVLCAHLIPV